MADYIPRTTTSGNPRGICPDCDGLMYRGVSLAKLSLAVGDLDVAFPHGEPRLGDTADPALDCDFGKGA